MSCAGCDDCHDGHWHLHVTLDVNPNRQDPDQVMRHVALLTDAKIVRVTNVLLDTSYEEIIPTLHVKGTESDAARQLFRMGVQLEKAGFNVKRLKIEGDARTVPKGRALYYEAHVKNVEPVGEAHARKHLGHFHLSVNSRGENIWTVRDEALWRVGNLYYAIAGPLREPRVEACALDTAPELDAAWLAGARAPELR